MEQREYLSDVTNSLHTPTRPLPGILQPRRRRSSLFDKWISEQHATPTPTRPPSPCPTISTTRQAHAYLAYPDLCQGFQNLQVLDEDTVSCLPDELGSLQVPPREQHNTLLFSSSYSPPKSPTSLKNFFSFRSSSVASGISGVHSTKIRQGEGSDTLPRRPKAHSRSWSLPILEPKASLGFSPPKKKWRASVFGVFTPAPLPSNSSEFCLSVSRPSLSSTRDTTMSEFESLPSISKQSFTTRSRGSSTSPQSQSPPSKRYRSPFSSMRYSPSSLSNETSESDENTDSTLLSRPRVAYINTAASNKGTFPRVFGASVRHKKKRKLIISGIGTDEPRRFQAAQRWLESFGEVSQITRMPNGDLHVFFTSSEVADTVCRLKATVVISGVGSVSLSWYTGVKIY